MNTKKLCIYHKNCLDGFASAFILGQFFGFDRVEFMAREYHDPLPDLTGRDVYILDFSYKPEVLLPALSVAKSVVMLDHHDGAARDWGMYDEVPPTYTTDYPNFVQVIDFSQSGVGVTWDFFYNNDPTSPTRIPMPSLLSIVQDYDMYKFEFTHTRAVQAALTSTRMMSTQNFDQFRTYVEYFDMLPGIDKKRVIEHGYVVLEAQEVWCRELIERTKGTVMMNGYIVPIANIPYDLRNIAGEIMYEGVPFSITYEDRLGEGIRKFSLRSDRETGVDVIEIAKRLGGSGHPNAAGFTLPLVRKPANEATVSDLLNF